MIGLAIALGLILIVYFETTPNTTKADEESQEDEEDRCTFSRDFTIDENCHQTEFALIDSNPTLPLILSLNR
jgi:hypothetical protein